MRYLAAVILTVVACSNQSFPLGMSGERVMDSPEPELVSTVAMPVESIEFHYEIPTTTTTTAAPVPPTTTLLDVTPELMLPDLYEVAGMIEELRVYLDLPDDRAVMAKSPEPPQFTLGQLVDYFFEPQDRAWAMRVAFCESSGQPGDITSDARHHRSGASGWFQHLPKFWEERSEAAGIPDVDIMDPIANVLVASWLLYETPQGTGHWYPSQSCWR